MDRTEFRSLLTHMEWADALTWKSVRDLPAAQTDDRLRYLLHHMHIVQLVYMQTWRGEKFEFTEVSSYPDLPSIRAWSKPYYAVAREFAASVDETRFGLPLEFPWAAMIKERYGEVAPATFAESAWQVFSHTSYHRGQVATRVREIGGEPALCDFLVWVWTGKPEPVWI